MNTYLGYVEGRAPKKNRPLKKKGNSHKKKRPLNGTKKYRPFFLKKRARKGQSFRLQFLG